MISPPKSRNGWIFNFIFEYTDCRYTHDAHLLFKYYCICETSKRDGRYSFAIAFATNFRGTLNNVPYARGRQIDGFEFSNLQHKR